MNTKKRLGLTALVVALGALVTASPAVARHGKRVQSYTVQLAPPVDAPEPDASGEWTHDFYAGGSEFKGQYVWPSECATVSCQRLTPGEQYVVRVLVEWDIVPGGYGSYVEERAVTANRKGWLDAEVWVYDDGGDSSNGDDSWWWRETRHIADLWIENAAGQIVLEER
jgi:hypothetical protein